MSSQIWRFEAIDENIKHTCLNNFLIMMNMFINSLHIISVFTILIWTWLKNVLKIYVSYRLSQTHIFMNLCHASLKSQGTLSVRSITPDTYFIIDWWVKQYDIWHKQKSWPLTSPEVIQTSAISLRYDLFKWFIFSLFY